MNLIEVTKNVPVAMRDGVELMTDVYRRADVARAPTLVQRLPYDKEVLAIGPDLFRYVQAGYAVVVQDTRGRFASGGEFRPFAEAADGADTIAWAAAQPWSTGRVGMFGLSYAGATQWLAAAERPPALSAIAPLLAGTDFYDGWTYQGGALRLGFVLFWAYNLALGEATRRLARGDGTTEELLDVVAHIDRLPELMRRRPLTDMPLLDRLAPYWREWLAHPARDDYWRAASPCDRYAQVQVPSLSIGGWHDIFLGGTLANYRGMREAGRPARLIVGPWAHAAQLGQFVERDFGLLAGVPGADLTTQQIRWFDRHLRPAPDDGADDPPVRLFVMGRGWRDEADWPLPGTRYVDYFLDGDGAANTADGDGRLTRDPPAGEATDTIVFDPLDPVPTVGGSTLMDYIGASAGPWDQRAVEARPDVLCFTSPPLAADLEATGPVELVLHVATSARDTDFTGKLVDVHPDGRAEIVTDGILRLRFRDSQSTPRLVTPGEVLEIRVDLVATAAVFPAGHRIRVEVSSSNFPKFDRNTNLGGAIADETDTARAVNRVFHGPARPSRLVLPIIERR